MPVVPGRMGRGGRMAVRATALVTLRVRFRRTPPVYGSPLSRASRLKVPRHAEMCGTFARAAVLEVPREGRPVGCAFLEERVTSLDGFVRSRRRVGRLTGEQLLAHQAVVEKVERELQHALCLRGFGVDLGRPPMPTDSRCA